MAASGRPGVPFFLQLFGVFAGEKRTAAACSDGKADGGVDDGAGDVVVVCFVPKPVCPETFRRGHRLLSFGRCDTEVHVAAQNIRPKCVVPVFGG